MKVYLIRMRPEGDNDFEYVIHPETNADMVIETATKKFVKPSDIVNWNSKAAGNHKHTEYCTKSELSSPGKASLSWQNIFDKPSKFTPIPHSHSIDDVTNLATALSGKSSINHTHNYANKTHIHSISDITDLSNQLSKKSNVGHTHDYANSSHTHSFNSLTGVPANRTRKILYQTSKPGNTAHPDGTICFVYK